LKNMRIGKIYAPRNQKCKSVSPKGRRWPTLRILKEVRTRVRRFCSNPYCRKGLKPFLWVSPTTRPNADRANEPERYPKIIPRRFQCWRSERSRRSTRAAAVVQKSVTRGNELLTLPKFPEASLFEVFQKFFVSIYKGLSRARRMDGGILIFEF
jgi:hypothetical protein